MEYDSTVPFTDGAEITPDDDDEFDPPYRSLYIGVSGDLNIRTVKGTVLLFKNVPVGILPGQVDKVLAASTTADEIIGLI